MTPLHLCNLFLQSRDSKPTAPWARDPTSGPPLLLRDPTTQKTTLRNLRRGIEQPCLTPLTLPRTKGTEASSQKRKGHWTKNADPVYSFRLKHKTRDNDHSNK